MSFQGSVKRLRPQRLIFDPLDAALLRRGMSLASRPLGELTVRVVEQLNAGEDPGEGTAIDPQLTLVTRRTPSGYLVFFDQILDARRGLVASGLAAGRHTIEVAGRFYQPLRLVAVLSDVPPPFDDLADATLTRASVRAQLEPSFLHPVLVSSTATRIGGVLIGEDAEDFVDVAVGIRMGGADLATYRVDPRGQWLLILDDAALGFPAPPAPQIAAVTVRVTRAGTVIATEDIDVTRNDLTTATTLDLTSL